MPEIPTDAEQTSLEKTVPPSRRALTMAWTRSHLHLVAPVVVYLMLVIFGVTTSNIGVNYMREDPAKPLGVQIMSASEIRSDEYTSQSPLWLGEMAVGGMETQNPLSASPDFFAQLPDGPVSAVVFFEGSLLTLGPWLPDAMLFAAKWWLPTLMLALGLPVWFRQITGSMRWGYLSAILIYFSPASAWWSLLPVSTLGFIFAGCALGIWGLDQFDKGRRGRAVAGLAVAGILLARFPSYYQPYAVMLGLAPVLATAAFLLVRPGPLRRKVIGLVAFGAYSAIVTGLLLLESWSAIAAGLKTVYPGRRSASGASLSIGQVFGATNLAWLSGLDTSTVTNRSEVSTSFTVLLAVLVILVVAQRWRGSRAMLVPFSVMTILALFWLSWCTLSWGHLGDHLPLVNWVTPGRASNAVGYLAIISFCMFMTQWRPPARRIVGVVAGLVAAGISAYAGSDLAHSLIPFLRAWEVGFSALVTGVVVALLVLRPRANSTLVATTVVAALLVITANPVLVGLADLRESGTASKMLAAGTASRKDGSLWVSDSTYVDALLLATGTPTLSGRQQVGPVVAEWTKLDPTKANEAAWNRGGTHIRFDWTSSTTLTFANPYPDSVLISGSPCTVKQDIPQLGFVVSHRPLSAACLTQTDTLEWSGINYIVYKVS